MRTVKNISNTITGIIISQKKEKTPRETADYIIEFLFEEDNLVVPPKQDFDLRLKMFNDFFEWHKKQGFVSIKKGDFQEWLWSL